MTDNNSNNSNNSNAAAIAEPTSYLMIYAAFHMEGVDGHFILIPETSQNKQLITNLDLFRCPTDKSEQDLLLDSADQSQNGNGILHIPDTPENQARFWAMFFKSGSTICRSFGIDLDC